MPTERPDWLLANPVIVGLLEYILDKRDAQILAGEQKPIAVTLDPARANRGLRPVLQPFTSPDYDDRELWDEIKWLSNEHRCFAIKQPPRRAAGSAPWTGARLYFKNSSEPLVRDWLHRPRPVLVDPAWREALAQFGRQFDNPAAFPPSGLDLDPGFLDFRQLLSCWASVGRELQTGEPLSWRQLSARCFLGDSKYLDNVSRQSLVRALFSSGSARVGERPVLMHLYLPAQFERVLLIENQDSFVWLAEREPAATALVYIEGYLGGAARIRSPGIARFSTVNSVAAEVRADFQQWWQGWGEQRWPVFFWGDLDFEGMNIATALKRSFPGLECWQPGYEPLLKRLADGCAHRPEQSGKQRQRLTVEQTGCAYADQVLIPAMLETGRFVDQEAVSADQLSVGSQLAQL